MNPHASPSPPRSRSAASTTSAGSKRRRWTRRSRCAAPTRSSATRRSFRRQDRADLPAQRRPGRRADPLVVCRAARRHPPDRQPAARARRRPGATRSPCCCPAASNTTWRSGAAKQRHRAAAQSAAHDEKLVSLMSAAGAKVLIAYGSDAESGIWSKAMRLAPQVPSLTAVLRVAPHDETQRAHRACRRACSTSTPARRPARRPARERPRHRAGRHRRLLPHRRHHRRAQARAPQPRRPGVHRLGQRDAAGHAEQTSTSTAIRCSTSPACCRLAGLAVGGRGGDHPDAFAVAQPQVLRNYWRLVEKYRPTSLSAVPTVLAALANVPLEGADISSLRYCRTGAAPLSPELAARFEQPVRPACAREPGHDRDGRHLIDHAAGRGGPGRLRRLSAAVCAAAHRRARRRRHARATAICRRASRAWCCSSRRTCSRASSTRRTTRRPSPPTAGSRPATWAGSTRKAG